jgi:hypothetical protein
MSAIMTVSSCSFINDRKIDAFENSIEKLGREYKEMTAEELEEAIKNCEEQKEYLSDEDNKFSNEQTKRIANLKGRYQNILVKIEVYTTVNNLFDVTEVESTLQYIKGLLTNE